MARHSMNTRTDSWVTVWEHQKKSLISQYRAVSFHNQFLWSPDSKHVAIGKGKDKIVLLDALSGKVQHILKTPPLQGRASISSTKMVFHPKNKSLWVLFENNDIRAWDVNGKIIKLNISLSNKNEPIITIRFSNDGNILLLGYRDRIEFVDSTSFIKKSQLNAFQGKMTDIKVSPDGKQLAVASSSGMIDIWNITTQTLTKQLKSPDKSMRYNYIKWNLFGSHIVAIEASLEYISRKADVWNIAKEGTPFQIRSENKSRSIPTTGRHVGISPSGRYLVISYPKEEDGESTDVWDVIEKKKLYTIPQVGYVGFSKHSSRLTLLAYRMIHYYDLNNGKRLRSRRLDEHSIIDGTFSIPETSLELSDQYYMPYGMTSHNTKVWYDTEIGIINLWTGKQEERFFLRNGKLFIRFTLQALFGIELESPAFRISRKRDYVAIRSLRYSKGVIQKREFGVGELGIWETKTGTHVTSLPWLGADIMQYDFANDNQLITSYRNNVIRIWNIKRDVP